MDGEQGSEDLPGYSFLFFWQFYVYLVIFVYAIVYILLFITLSGIQRQKRTLLTLLR